VTKFAEGRRWLEKWVKAEKEGCEEAMRVARYWPRLEIVSAEFKGEYGGSLSNIQFQCIPSRIDLQFNGFCGGADQCPVPGEKVVSPSSIVQLIYRVRYVYPITTSAPVSPTALPNSDSRAADVKVEANGDAPSLKVKSEAGSVAEVEDAVTKIVAEDEKLGIKAEVEGFKEHVAESVENSEKEKEKEVGKQEVGKKGKVPNGPVRKWASNGYAHAPHWPMVSSTPLNRTLFIRSSSDQVRPR
jgi:translocation protein SEC63